MAQSGGIYILFIYAEIGTNAANASMFSSLVNLSNRASVRKSLTCLKVNGFLKVQQKIRFPFREYFDKTTTTIFISQIFSRAVFRRISELIANSVVRIQRALPHSANHLCR